MFDWLIPWFAIGYSAISAAVDRVRDALTQVVNIFLHQFARWTLAALYATQRAWWVFDVLRTLAVELPAAIWHILFETIPAWGARIFNYVDQKIVDAINSAVSFAQNLVNWAIATARQWVDDAINFARSILNFATDWINRIWTLLVPTAERVLALLTDPRALADWIAGQIIQATFRYLVGNAATLSRWAFSVAIRGAIGAADLAEQVIVDLFL